MKKYLSIAQDLIKGLKNFSIKDIIPREVIKMTNSLSKPAFEGARPQKNSGFREISLFCRKKQRINIEKQVNRMTTLYDHQVEIFTRIRSGSNINIASNTDLSNSVN